MTEKRPIRRVHLRFGGLIYLGVAVFIGAAAVNSQTNLLFWTFGLMLGGLVVSGVISGWMLRKVRVRRLLPDHGAVDEPLIIRYQIANHKRLMPCFALVVTELDGVRAGGLRGKPHGLVLHVGPGAEVQAESTGWPGRRGPVQLHRVRLSTTFPFGVLRKSVTFSQPGRVVVYPKLHRLHPELLKQVHAMQPAGARPGRQSGGDEEFFGLREYRGGDSVKRVDWKHTARLGKLVSREMTQLTPPRLMILLNLQGREHLGAEAAERAISFAASVACEARRAHYSVGLLVRGVPCPNFEARPGRFHQTRILHALGELDLTAGGSNTWPAPAVRDARWLVIHAGPIDEGEGPAGAAHVSAGQLAEWTRPTSPTAEPPRLHRPIPDAPPGVVPAGAGA